MSGCDADRMEKLYAQKPVSRAVREDVLDYAPRRLQKDEQKTEQIKILKVQTDESCKSRHYYLPSQNKGAVTVEAALVLPIVILISYSFLLFFQILNVQMRLQTAMEDVVSEMAVSEYAVSLLPGGLEETEGDISIKGLIKDFIVQTVVSEIKAELVEQLVIEKVGREWLDSCSIVGGSRGIDFSMSALSMKADIIDITATYSYALPILPSSLFYLDFGVRSIRHIWTGIDREEKLPDNAGNGDTSEAEPTEIDDTDKVYVTKNGKVYHLFRDCRTLNVTVKTAEYKEMKNKRNSGGAKYYPCEFCVRGDANIVVYYTPQGDRYHNSKTCGSLMRYVEKISKTAVAGRDKCSICAKRELLYLDEQMGKAA